MSKSQAYTLIELLISISIMGLLFAVGTLSYRDFTRRQGVGNAAKQVVSDLRLAQQQALSGYKPTGCNGTLDQYNFAWVDNKTYQVVAHCVSPNSDITVKQGLMPGNTMISSFTTVGFKPVAKGTSLSAGTNITITIGASDTTTQQTVTVSSAGDIR